MEMHFTNLKKLSELDGQNSAGHDCDGLGNLIHKRAPNGQRKKERKWAKGEWF